MSDIELRLNPNADENDYAKDILLKKKNNAIIPTDMEMQWLDNVPYAVKSNAIPQGKSESFPGNIEKTGFFETAAAEAYEFNATFEALNVGYDKVDESIIRNDIAPPGWSPKQDPSKFLNIESQYMGYLFEATNPRDLDFRINKVRQEQHHDEILANGSMTARIFGGIAGALTDPVSYIPIVGFAKYAKFAPTIMKSAARAFPGIATTSVLQAAAKQSDKVNGNIHDFLLESFTNTVFGSVLFGGLGAGGLLLNKMELWNIRKLAQDSMNGIDYKLHLTDKGEVKGFTAFDTTNSLSAAEVSKAQEIADSSFAKSGIFKIPYVGEGALKLFSMPGLGSPLPRLLTHKYETVRAAVARIASNNIVTEGMLKGFAKAPTFSDLMSKEFASMKAISSQVNALFLERNGVDIKSRLPRNVAEVGLGLYNSTLKKLIPELNKTSWIDRDQFYDEVQTALRTGQSSEHAAVNDAAAIFRKKIDDTYAKWREAYNLPKEWMPPKTSEEYLMRVYNLPYMNVNEDAWIKAVSGWLEKADNIITERMKPIEDLENEITNFKEHYDKAFKELGIRQLQLHPSREIAYTEQQGVAIREYVIPPTKYGKKRRGERETKLESYEDVMAEYHAMENELSALKQTLQNELRNNPDLQLHVDDWNALSHDESEELKALLKPQKEILKKIDEQKEIISDLKKKKSAKLITTKKQPTVEKAKPHAAEFQEQQEIVDEAELKLHELQNEYQTEYDRIQQLAHEGKINPRFYTKKPESFEYQFKNPDNKLKFRERYNTEKNPVTAEAHAKAYYNTIMNQTAEHTIAQVMGRMTGNAAENHLKSRSILIPDEIIAPFMTKDLMAKVNNYVSYLARRTHLKTVFNDVSVDGGFEPLIANLAKEHEQFRAPLNSKLTELREKLKTSENKTEIQKQINKIEKELIKDKKTFDSAKKDLNHLYNKMMGINNESFRQKQIRSAIMSFTAMANLPFVPFSMINDLSAIGLQHGLWPFIRDGVYPIIQSLGGILKTKDSEELRKAAPSIHLALQDVLNGYAHQNWSSDTQPYLNLGKWVSGLEKIAHSNANFTGTNYIDNGLQHITSAVSSAEFMRILHAHQAGTMTEKEGLYLLKYGIDPKIWGDRMVNAFKKDGGGKTKLGGYRSAFWQWSDMEASNHFGDAVFRAVKSTQIQRGIADSPFWADNFLGSLVHGFAGWTYASLNRYVIPSMQKADFQVLLGISFMLGTGALVSPMRRIARGEEPYKPDQTPTQIAYEAFSDSGYFSYFSNALNYANVLFQPEFMKNLKNDKYKDRTRVGLLGPWLGTANRSADIVGMVASREFNETDAKKAARMVPYANSSWTYWLSKRLVESIGLPKTRAAAHNQEG